ncbi:MAG: hypothetical protein ACM30I_10660 [Gemmatimonas sp.]
MTGRNIGYAFGALALSVVFFTRPAAAQPPDQEFFDGKTISYLSASAPGSDLDRFDRMVAAEMQKALPTTVTVRNVGDHTRDDVLTRVAAARPDGLTIASLPGAVVYEQLTGQAPVDLRRLSWIGGSAGNPHVLVVPDKSPIHAVKDLRQPGDPFVLGISRVSSSTYIETRMLQAALHLNVRVVAGFRGGDEIRSVNAGTVDAVFGPECLYRDFIDDGLARVVLRFGAADGGDEGLAKVLRHADDGTRETLALLQSVSALGNVTAAPPTVPPRRLQALRAMFRAAVESDDVRDAYPGALVALGGRDVARAVSAALHPGPHAMALIRDTFDVEGGPVLASASPRSTDRGVVSFVGAAR